VKIRPWLHALLALAGTFGFSLVMGFDPRDALFLTVMLFVWALLAARFVVSRESSAR
jgi:hypothetical protein